MRARFFGAAVVGLTALIAILTVLVIQTWTGGSASAETAMSAPNMVAVTGRVGSDVSVLYVIDTDKKQLAVYTAPLGKRIRFIGARRIKYDFELMEYNDASQTAYRVRQLADQYRKHKLDQENANKGKDRR